MKKMPFNLAVIFSSLLLLPLNAFDTSQLLADKGYFPTGDELGVSPTQVDDESDDGPSDDDDTDDQPQRKTLLRSSKDPASTTPEADKGYFPDQD